MKIGIMQPYIFPYLGYWQVMNKTDRWIFFDTVQYNKRSWMNRNRIMHPNPVKEYQYISVPIKKHPRGTLINEVEINQDINWRETIKGQLTVYKQLRAPYYDDVHALIESILDEAKMDSFLELCILSSEAICKSLHIAINYKIASQTDFDRERITAPGEWALEICKAQKADMYINPYSGYDIFDEENYRKNNIELRFLKPAIREYTQSKRERFVPSLSIIDMLMFTGFSYTEKSIKNDFSLYTKDDLIKGLQDEERGKN